jgi:hypothetical protein
MKELGTMQCPTCGHTPIMHIQDGTTTVCRLCHFLNDQGQLERYTGLRLICMREFKFKLSRVEREQAAKADRETYKPHTICADCDYEWQQHMGYLCPSGDSTFVPLLDSMLPFVRVQ